MCQIVKDKKYTIFRLLLTGIDQSTTNECNFFSLLQITGIVQLSHLNGACKGATGKEGLCPLYLTGLFKKCINESKKRKPLIKKLA